MQGNAAAGGVMLALAADLVYARKGIVLNPHYKGMDNLYGSEYWTYLLPKRVGASKARELTEALLPVSTRTAQQIGLIDGAFEEDTASFRHHIIVIRGKTWVGDLLHWRRVRARKIHYRFAPSLNQTIYKPSIPGVGYVREEHD